MNRPNILLFLMDGAQAAALESGSGCLTPNFDKLRERGLNFSRCYTPSPTCSPARASFMTGLLPHNHGVLEVEHGRDPDQCVLRANKPHFAQRLRVCGYQTGYFGKWHIERTNQLEDFGWDRHFVKGAKHHANLGKGQDGGSLPVDDELSGYLDGPPGYRRVLHWGVTDVPAQERYPQSTIDRTLEFFAQCQDDRPWLACASFSEPNESLIVSRPTFERYDPSTIALPETLHDDFAGRPNFYRREREISRKLSAEHWRMARTCYFGRITELDDQFGRLTEKLDDDGNTIVIVTADHGRYVGAHGFDAHNFGPFEEIYRVPLLVAGPGIEPGSCSRPVNLHDLCPTICELAGADSIDVPDSKSLLPQLHDANLETGPAYAENHGTRFRLTQRILWDGSWKLAFNGFDFDELYNLDEDPNEQTNLAADPRHRQRLEAMMRQIWGRIRETGDRALEETHYFSMRLGCVGPEG